MPHNEALQQTEKACIERCKRFGETHQQRWVKEASADLLSHLYKALGERLELYTEHYRMPALIAYYNDLAKKHPGNSQAVIDTIRALGNPENDVARAERYIATFRQKSEAQWQALEDQLNEKRRAANEPFEPKEIEAVKASKTYKDLETELTRIGKKRARLLRRKQTVSLTEEKLAHIRAQQIALSIREVECQLKMRRKIVSRNGFSYEPSCIEEREQIRAEVNICENYDEYTAMERIRDFCDTENLFQANDLMRELERYSTVEEIAASDLYELEKEIRDKPYDRSTDYEFCLPEANVRDLYYAFSEFNDTERHKLKCLLLHEIDTNSAHPLSKLSAVVSRCFLIEFRAISLDKEIMLELGAFLEKKGRTDLKDKLTWKETWKARLEVNKIAIQINHQTNAQGQSEPVIQYFVRSRVGGLLEGRLTREDVSRVLKNHPDAITLIQHIEEGTEEDLVSAKYILQAHVTAFKNDIYQQLEKQTREIAKKKEGTDEEREEYFEQYERNGKHVGIYRQSAEERNQMIRDGFEYVFEHVMKPIAEERARLSQELIKTKEASAPLLEEQTNRLKEITDDPTKACWRPWMGMATEQAYRERKIQELEEPIVVLQQKVDYLSGEIRETSESIKAGYGSHYPFSDLGFLLARRSRDLDASYRQTRTGILEDIDKIPTSSNADILNQARDYVTNFVRKLVGMILIPLRAILGPCAPESLQKQAFYNTQSAHRLFKAKSDWEKYNKSTEKEFGLPLRNLAL